MTPSELRPFERIGNGKALSVEGSEPSLTIVSKDSESTPGGLLYGSTCACGWRGCYRSTLDSAVASGTRHLQVTHGGDDR